MKKILIFLSLLFFIVGCTNKKDIVPSKQVDYIGKYHCFPYDVKIYKIKDLLFNENFFQYPKESFCSLTSDCNLIKWTKFSEYDEEECKDLIAYINKCDGNRDILNQINLGKEIYFAGCYKNFKNNKNESYRIYDLLAFIDVEQKKMHVFSDIQVR